VVEKLEAVESAASSVQARAMALAAVTAPLGLNTQSY
jgi:hypothetical protein